MLEFWEEDSTWDRYQFDGEPGEVIAIELPIAVTTRLLQDASGRPRLCERHEIFDDRLAQLIYMMWDAASSQVPRGGLYAEGLSLSLLGLLLRDYCKDPMATRRSNCLSPRQRARVLAFIDAELGSKLTVAQLAEVVGMSPFHFARQFRETFGQSPYAFVSERRVEAACLALRRQPSVSVAAVAMGHGFYSQQHFTEAFKRRMGTTPSRWRAEL
jgi:AraC-like DNA-binding protein